MPIRRSRKHQLKMLEDNSYAHGGILIERDGKDYPSNAFAILTGNGGLHVATQCGVFKGTTKAVYDNRLEITSPGKLPMGQTIERMKEGYFKIRNEALAHAFAYMNLIEHWGSGMPRIIDKVKTVGLREPEFIGGEVDLRINIYRGQIVPNAPNRVPDNEQEQQIYKYVLENGYIATAEAVELLGVKDRRARTVLMNMVEDNYLRKEGAARGTIYVKNMEGR